MILDLYKGQWANYLSPTSFEAVLNKYLFSESLRSLREIKKLF